MAQDLALGVIASLGTDPLAALQHVRSLGVPTTHISYPAAMDSEVWRPRIFGKRTQQRGL
jgi:hypothetical protein